MFDCISQVLAHCAAHLALAPKSTAVYAALSAAFAHIDSCPNPAPPLTIRNAPTRLMRDLGYGADYVYTPEAASEEQALAQNYLPVRKILFFVVFLIQLLEGRAQRRCVSRLEGYCPQGRFRSKVEAAEIKGRFISS